MEVFSSSGYFWRSTTVVKGMKNWDYTFQDLLFFQLLDFDIEVLHMGSDQPLVRGVSYFDLEKTYSSFISRHGTLVQ